GVDAARSGGGVGGRRAPGRSCAGGRGGADRTARIGTGIGRGGTATGAAGDPGFEAATAGCGGKRRYLQGERGAGGGRCRGGGCERCQWVPVGSEDGENAG